MKMSIRQDWFRVARSLHGFVSTLQSAVAWEERGRSRKARPVTLSIRSITDIPMVAEIELARSRVLVHNLRNQLR